MPSRWDRQSSCIAALALALTACGGASPTATEPEIRAGEIEARIAAGAIVPESLDAQLALGRSTYHRECVSCHGEHGEGRAGPQLIGRGALPVQPPEGSRRDKPFDCAASLVTWLRQHMPGARPGSLDDGAYVNVAAYLLEANGVPLAPRPITEASAYGIPLAPRGPRGL